MSVIMFHISFLLAASCKRQKIDSQINKNKKSAKLIKIIWTTYHWLLLLLEAVNLIDFEDHGLKMKF